MTSNWSAENATKAYLRALKMGKGGKEPDVGEFISALAAGNNSQLMVMVSSNSDNDAKSTVLALMAAAHQTSGRTICILPDIHHIHQTKQGLGPYENSVEFVVGNDARILLLNECRGADFVVIDCNVDDYKVLFGAAKEGLNDGNIKGVVVGYNALHKESWCKGGSEEEENTHFLPIGEGLLVTKIGGAGKVRGSYRRRSRWVVKVDECTGEEHVFRITSQKEIKA